MPSKWKEYRVKGEHKIKQELKSYRAAIGKLKKSLVLCQMEDCARLRVAGCWVRSKMVSKWTGEQNMLIVDELIERKERKGGKLYPGFLDSESI